MSMFYALFDRVPFRLEPMMVDLFERSPFSNALIVLALVTCCLSLANFVASGF